jgi:hypothetical protein
LAAYQKVLSDTGFCRGSERYNRIPLGQWDVIE